MLIVQTDSLRHIALQHGPHQFVVLTGNIPGADHIGAHGLVLIALRETLREAGLTLDSSCQEGICGVCETRVIAGIPDHRDAVLSEHEHATNKSIMICCSGSKSERLVLDL